MPKKKAKQSKKRKKMFKDLGIGEERYIGELAGYPVFSTSNFRCEKHALKKYSDSDLIEAAKEERQKIFTIINYILNKNSRPLSQGGVNYERAYDEMQDLEHYLLEDL